MQKENIGLSIGIQGMERQNFSHLDDEKVFTFQLNGNLETDEEGIGLTNEHSNILCSRFKPGYIVIGTKYDRGSNRVIFFLTTRNPINGKHSSEIGYIDFTSYSDDASDIELECGCDIKSYIESTDTILNYCKYNTLLSDDCNNCLNFSPNTPIKSIEIKEELIGKTITFTDGVNPPRYFIFDDLDRYHHTGSVICGEDNTVETCLDCEKLRIFNLYDKPCLVPESMEYGGNLKRGKYEFMVAYCDVNGAEMSPYFSITNPISVFDINNNILEQKDQANVTNYSIKLHVVGLDVKYTHYKIAVIQTADVSQVTEYLIEGIHPVTDNIVLYTTDTGKERVTLQQLMAQKPIYKTWGGLTSANNYMFGFDYTVEEEWNLQPVVNLMGSLLKWQTVEAYEKIFEDGVLDSKYTGYMRDEVYPLSIRFITDTGYTTANFPFISRPATLDDMLDMTNMNNDIKSVLSNSTSCSTTERKYKWQFYNTASKDSLNCSTTSNIKTEEVKQEVESSCNIELTPIVDTKWLLPISDDFNYVDIKSYVNQGMDEIDEMIAEYGDEYPDLYKIKNLITPSNYQETCPSSWNSSDIFPFPICSNESDCIVNTCDIPVKNGEYVDILSAIGETSTKNKRELDDYKHSSTTGCTNIPSVGEGATRLLMAIVEGDRYHFDNVFDRMVINDNFNCDNLLELPAKMNTFSPFSYPNPDQGMSVTTTYPTLPVGNFNQNADSWLNVSNFVSRDALWFTIELSEEKKILEITPFKGGRNSDGFSGTSRIRYTIYENCKTLNIIEVGLYDSDKGLFKEISKSIYNGRKSMIIVLEPEYSKKEFRSYEKVGGVVGGNIRAKMNYRIVPDGCFDINIRDVEYKDVNINIDTILIEKTINYISTCRYLKPIFTKCEPSPYSKGKFAYWESTEIYPDNQELYDSSKLNINDSMLRDLKPSLLSEFKSNYVISQSQHKGTEGYYIWKNTNGKNETDFTCRPIRHFKFPDNRIAPFMDTRQMSRFSENIVYPLGVTIDTSVITSFLKVAVENELISEDQMKSIHSFEIFRGDRTIHKSIITKGLVNDMYEDTKNSNNRSASLFRNFPYNSIGDNPFLNINDNSDELVHHPFGSESNYRFSLISPHVYYDRPEIPTEVDIEGYMYGNSTGGFRSVRGHSEWTILGDKAYSRASKLATAEVIAESVMSISNALIESSKNSYVGGGMMFFGNPMQAGGYVAAAAITAVNIVESMMYRYDKFKNQWLQIYEDMGDTVNYADMFVSSKGWYNSFEPNIENGDRLRGLLNGKYLKPGRIQFVEKEDDSLITLNVNNIQREDSIYLSFGSKYKINYPKKYKTYDNYNISKKLSSSYLSSDSNCDNNISSTRNIASPYFALKNYVPSQYGTIDSVRWLPINHCGRLDDDSECKSIFGGDTRISRVDFKNKYPFFLVNALELANRIPFDYRRYPNVASPRFWVSYKSGNTGNDVTDVPFLNTHFNLDCRPNGRKFYEGRPSKFYLYSYGVPYFLIESEINANYRYAGKEPHEQFASNGIDVEEWVQEKNVSIHYNNIFFYNNVYSKQSSATYWRILSSVYDKKTYSKLSRYPNGFVWSQQDNSEVSLNDPWLVYRPLNIGYFDTKHGKLIDMRNIESEQIMVRFENNMAIFNPVDVLRDRLNPENEFLGTGGMNGARPVTFSNTELGDAGTQHKALVSCEFGHFWADAKRGKVLQLSPNAKDLNAISDYKSNGAESGMRKWFKRHLPFKILKGGIKGLTDLDLDNPYKGLGIVMWWDAKFKRLFLTKRDYTVIGSCIEYNNGSFYINETKCNGVPQSIVCKEGFTYDPEIKMCVRTYSKPMCDDGDYNSQTGLCETIETTDVISTIITETSESCPEGYTKEGNICKKIEYADKICPDDTVVVGNACTRETNIPLDVVFIKDRSGSVDATESNQLADAMTAIVDGVVTSLSENKIRIANVIFDSGSSLVNDLTSDINLIKSGINRGTTNGLTNIASGVCTAMNTLSKSTNRKLILLFIDGINNVSGSCLNIVQQNMTRDFVNKMVDLRLNKNVKIGIIYVGDSSQGIEDVYINTTTYEPVPSLGSGVNRRFAYRADSFNALPNIVDNVVDELNDDIEIVPKICPVGYTPMPLPFRNCVRILTVPVETTTTETTLKSCPVGYSLNEDETACIKTKTSTPCSGCNVIQSVCECSDYMEPEVSDVLTEIELTDTRYFKDASWTVSYSPLYQSWISYYDYKPDYAIAYNDYFQTGLNYPKKESNFGLWTHLISNRSYNIFYGDKYSWIIEVLVKNTYTNNILNDLNVWGVSQRYHNYNDYAVWRKKFFNKLVVYNQTNNSGILNLEYEDSLNKSKYPIQKSSIEQIIPATHFDDNIRINYFYNRVRNESNHLPIWNWDSNEIEKTLNPDAISFTSKRVLERLRGDWFTTRFIMDNQNTHDLKHYFKWMQYSEKSYQ